MSSELILVISMAGSIVASLLIWWWLHDALREMLNQLCDRPGSTKFWSRYTLLMLVIAPLAVAIAFSPDYLQDNTQVTRRILLTILLSHFVTFAWVGRSLFKAVRERVAQDRAIAGPDASRG